VDWAFQPIKAETKFLTNFMGWNAHATFGCGCRGAKIAG
jgi:hypothetical protein